MESSAVAYPPSLLEQLSQFEDAGRALGAFWYHGTGTGVKGALRPSFYDGCLWLAPTPAVAQCYIPKAGFQRTIVVSEWQLRQLVWPRVVGEARQAVADYELALGLGFPQAEELEIGADGEVARFLIPAHYPRYSDLVRRLKDWGYQSECRFDYRAQVTIDGGHVQRAGYSRPGQLFVVAGVERLRLYDVSGGGECDLADPQYHRLADFRAAEAAGYDGVVIGDLCQSKNHGNVVHQSLGVFSRGLERLRYESIPALKWDWPADASISASTPDFEQLWEAASQLREPAIEVSC